MTAAATAADLTFLDRAVELALAAERAGNLPVGALLVLAGEVVAEAAAATFVPQPHPGRHAEVQALARLPAELAVRLPEATCYTTLEPCLMCFGALVVHRIGRVVFGALDPRGGAVGLVDSLPPHVAAKARAIRWIGPAAPESCEPLARRTLARYWAAPDLAP